MPRRPAFGGSFGTLGLAGLPLAPFPLHRLDKLDAGETTGSKVPCLSPSRDRAALRPDAMPVANRTPPALLPGTPLTAPVLTPPFMSFDPSSAVHLRSPSRPTPDAVKPRLLNWTLTTMALNQRSSSRFAARSCHPAARGLLSSQTQLLLAHKKSVGNAPTLHPQRGVCVTPTSRPSGPSRRVTVWPRVPCDWRRAVGSRGW